MKKLLTVFICMFFVGCITMPWDPPERNFPKDIESLCWHALNESEKGIESCGTPLKATHNLRVIKVTGQKKFNNGWAWQEPLLENMWIYGLFQNNQIKIASDPETSAVNYNVLFHECGHYWLVTNYHIYDHPAKYDSVFNWSWIDYYLSTRVFVDTNNEIIIVDYVQSEEE